MARLALLARVRKWIVVLLALALLLPCVPLHSFDDEARVIDRVEPDDDWTFKGTQPWAIGIRASRSAMRCLSENELTTFPGRALACERIWILNRSTGRASRDLGLALQSSLLDMPGLTEAAYFPLSDQPLAIERPPDLFVTIEVEGTEDLWLPFYSTFSARVHITASRVGFIDPGSMFSLQTFAYKADLIHREVGLTAISRRYESLVKGIVEDLALREQIEEVQNSAGRIPSPPLSVIPRAGTSLESPPLDLARESLLYSQAGLGVVDQSCWSIETRDRESARAELDRLAEAAEASGWTLSREEWVHGVTATHPDSAASRHLSLFLRGELMPAGLTVHHFQAAAPGDILAVLREGLEEGMPPAGLATGFLRLPEDVRREVRALAETSGEIDGLSSVLSED